MKTERNILIAFLLNLFFAIFEFVGGVFTGSVAIVSDAVHDLGDAAGIGLSWLLEKKSKRQPDARYTYGYARYSVIGSVITTLILLAGSCFVIYKAVCRVVAPTPIHYDGMILFAIVGVAVNFCAAYFTREGDSLNQKAVNLHMLEDVLGWVVVLVGAVVMRFTDLVIIDPILSLVVAVFILLHALKTLKAALRLLLEQAPQDVELAELRAHILEINGVQDVHHIHLWSMDGVRNYATMHIVTDGEAHHIKDAVREELREHGIGHATLELERVGEHCHERDCHLEPISHTHHHHH